MALHVPVFRIIGQGCASPPVAALEECLQELDPTHLLVSQNWEVWLLAQFLISLRSFLSSVIADLIPKAFVITYSSKTLHCDFR